MIGSNPSSLETQQQISADVQDRLGKAVSDLESKYANSSKVEQDSSVDAPTGQAYKDADKLRHKQRSIERNVNTTELMSDRDTDNSLIIEDDDGANDEDIELRNLREKRLQQMKVQQKQKIENIGKGHGQYRDIVQDEFLSEVTSSIKVICHFYHREFPRCEVMNHHLGKLAIRHIETKFVRINAEKSPFFVSKLSIMSLPTVVYFVDGVAVGKLIGFDGLSNQMPPGKEDEWPTIALARLLANVNMIDSNVVVDDDGIEAAMKAKMEELRKQSYLSAQVQMYNLDDEDFSDTE